MVANERCIGQVCAVEPIQQTHLDMRSKSPTFLIPLPSLTSQGTLSLTPLTSLALARRLSFKQDEASAFVLKFPISLRYTNPPLLPKAHLQIGLEKQSLYVQISEAVTRLKILLMMSNIVWLLEHVRIAWFESGGCPTISSTT
ncbi:hypothetical protein PanWU01x14_255900 [Parasponia andersonii]|uniref:Uncharacterized protein n=1 Tax=Parasponia andersonii TaxID=3476 RepID=A0A2P5BAJ6_PARAD|nr:hypothetical protein PanWU01x14_255900 [Parasponia andersonii]